jgi:hypothetical protein
MRPPSRAYTHDASRRARISSQSDIRVAACVCARWAGPGRKWAQADRGLTTNEASRSYSEWSNPESSFEDGVGGMESRSRDIRDEDCRRVARTPSSPLGPAPAYAEPVPVWPENRFLPYGRPLRVSGGCATRRYVVGRIQLSFRVYNRAVHFGSS